MTTSEKDVKYAFYLGLLFMVKFKEPSCRVALPDILKRRKCKKARLQINFRNRARLSHVYLNSLGLI